MLTPDQSALSLLVTLTCEVNNINIEENLSTIADVKPDWFISFQQLTTLSTFTILYTHVQNQMNVRLFPSIEKNFVKGYVKPHSNSASEARDSVCLARREEEDRAIT
jgi:hypothetical protein